MVWLCLQAEPLENDERTESPPEGSSHCFDSNYDDNCQRSDASTPAKVRFSGQLFIAGQISAS